MIVGFLAALRGEEVVMCSFEGLRKHFVEGILHPEHPHVPITLLGRFKGKTGEWYHIMPIVLRSASGIDSVTWVVGMLEMYNEMGIVCGWVLE